jgi:hypothetical protein
MSVAEIAEILNRYLCEFEFFSGEVHLYYWRHDKPKDRQILSYDEFDELYRDYPLLVLTHALKEQIPIKHR